MGLDTSHDCWHGPYSAFMRWRTMLAAEIGLPLPLMRGFCSSFKAMPDDAIKLRDYPPIEWPSAASEPLVMLLNHSDCDGEIAWEVCEAIAGRLDEIVETVIKRDGLLAVVGSARADYDGFVAACERFAAGCRKAHAAKENVRFS